MLFVLGIIGILSAIATPQMLRARQSAGATSAIGSLRAISSAQLTFALTCGGGFYAPKMSTLGNPPPGSTEPFIAGGLGTADTAIKSNYRFQMSATAWAGAPASCNGLAAGSTGQGFKASADPTEPDNPRFFAINANTAVFEHTASLAAIMPEVGDPPIGHVLQ
ncbi:MAG: type IV pilin protein [Betaproteobacteria bacterium]